ASSSQLGAGALDAAGVLSPVGTVTATVGGAEAGGGRSGAPRVHAPKVTAAHATRVRASAPPRRGAGSVAQFGSSSTPRAYTLELGMPAALAPAPAVRSRGWLRPPPWGGAGRRTTAGDCCARPPARDRARYDRRTRPRA